MDSSQIKNALSMEKLLEHYHAQKTSINQYWCFVHEAGGQSTGHKTPSLVLHPSSQTLSCKSQNCFAGDDIFGVIAKMNKLDVKNDFEKILSLAASIAGLVVDDEKADVSALPRGCTPLTPLHADYLKNRGLTEVTIKLMDLMSLYDHIVFAYRNSDGVTGYKAKTIINKKEWDDHKQKNPKWLSYFIKGKKPAFWFFGGLREKQIIYLVAGEYDLATLYQAIALAGRQEEIGVITLVTGEATSIPRDAIKFFTEFKNIEWRIVYDFDKTGLENMPLRAKELIETRKKILTFTWKDEMNPNKNEGYDINDYFRDHKNIDVFLDENNFQEVKSITQEIVGLPTREEPDGTVYSYQIGQKVWEFQKNKVTIRNNEHRILYQKQFSSSITLADKTQATVIRDVSDSGIYSRQESRSLVMKLAMQLLNDNHPKDENPPEEKVELLDREISLDEIHTAVAKIGIISTDLLEITMAIGISSAMEIQVPLWLIVIGNPSSNKTEVIKLLRGLKEVIYLSSMSENAFSSGFLPPDGSDPKDLLSILHKKIFLIRDLTTMFSLNEETVKKILGDFTSIFDGEYEKFTATRGLIKHRAIFPLIACITPAILSKHHNYVNQLGSRFLFFRVPNLSDEGKKKGYDIAWSKENRGQNIKTATMLVSSYCTQILKTIREEMMPTINDSAIQEWINNAADFIACSRGSVITAPNTFKNDEGKDVTYYEVQSIQKEEPWRALHQLRNLLIALAILHKKSSVDLQECDIVKSIVRSTAPVDRAEVMNALINSPGITANEIAGIIQKSKKTVDRKLKELSALGLVVRYKSPDIQETAQAPWFWAVEPKFATFLEGSTIDTNPALDLEDTNSEEGEEIDLPNLFPKNG